MNQDMHGHIKTCDPSTILTEVLGTVYYFGRNGEKYESRHAWTYQDLRSVDYFDRRGLRYNSRHAWTFQDMRSVGYFDRRGQKYESRHAWTYQDLRSVDRKKSMDSHKP
jgi:hypothetical protein